MGGHLCAASSEASWLADSFLSCNILKLINQVISVVRIYCLLSFRNYLKRLPSDPPTLRSSLATQGSSIDTDNMAEVIGVMASGIAIAQLAGSIASSIIKLKGFWSQMDGAPAEINHLLRQLESFNLILQQMQHDQLEQGIPDLSARNLCVRRSLELCEECATELSTLVNYLDAKLRGKKGIRKKIGSANVVLNKEDIRSLERRLNSAAQMLLLSYQFHTRYPIPHFTSKFILTWQCHNPTSARNHPNETQRPLYYIEYPTIARAQNGSTNRDKVSRTGE